jgi:heme-degrading monooxygenase HmoA
MYYVIWQYEVPAENREKFEELYSRKGAWFKLFERSDSYLGHELIRNLEDGSYVLIDKWMEKADFDHFYKVNQLEYDGLNSQSQDLYNQEKKIGDFETL